MAAAAVKKHTHHTSGKKELPIQKHLPKILASLNDNRVVELFAPTGTGKSTGFAHDFVAGDWREHLQGNCIMSIPTIVGVNTLFSHVSKLLGEKASLFGCGAGGVYTPNFDSASLCVCTTQVVINRLLRLYSEDKKMDDLIVVIDEAHHTSTENYVLIYLCDWLIEQGFGLRVLIMTATPSVYDLKFLVATQTFRISRDEVVHFDITEHWLHTDVFSVADITKCNTPFSRLSDEILRQVYKACDVCPGNGLIFVPGEGEAEELAALLRYKMPDIIVETLYSSMSREEIELAIAPVSGTRKIIIATNIAECSVTFDIDFVIDTLCHKEIIMRNRNGRVYGELSMQIISNAARLQRRGRCGRIRPGHYFAMCTQFFNEQMMPHTVSNFVNGDKAMSVLNLMRSNMPAFEILRMNPTDIELVKRRLIKFGLIDDKAHTCTSLGKAVTSFSLPLEFAVLLFNCNEQLPGQMFEICILVAIIAAKDAISSPIYYPKGIKGEAKREFVQDNFNDYYYSNDIVGLVRLLCEVIIDTNWCTKNTGAYMRNLHLNEKFFRHAIRMLKQIMPRFFKERPTHKMFHDLIDDIQVGNVFHGLADIAAQVFPTYICIGGRYIECLNDTNYILDNCRMANSFPSKIVAFSQCAITMPNKRGFGTITMNILSMYLPTH